MKSLLKVLSLIFAGVLPALLSYSTLNAMSWPCEDAVLVRNFGSNDRGRPVVGMVFSGDTDILAAERGEIIFTRSSNDTISKLPSPLGSWTAIDHGDGLISIYSRYADPVDLSSDILSADTLSEDIPLGDEAGETGFFLPSSAIQRTSVEKQEPIAVTGISGRSTQTGFYFMVYDRRERRWVNPEMIITPRQELNPPRIVSVELRNEQGIPVPSRNITQGRYTIHVNAAGTPASRVAAAQGVLLAPHRIICLVNGAEAGSLTFESVSARDGVLMVHRNGLVPAGQVYSGFPSFETAEVFLNRGQVNLEIIVYDITGNSRSEIYRLFVN